MDNSKSVLKLPSNFRLSIRLQLALMSMVALALSLYVLNSGNAQLKAKLEAANFENSQLRAKIEGAFPRPHIRLDDDQPLESGYTTTSNVSMTGQLYPVDHSAIKTGVVVAKMLDPENGRVLGQVTDKVNSRGNFAFTIKHAQDLQPGFYPVVVELFDGNKRVSFANSTVKLGDPAGNKQ